MIFFKYAQFNSLQQCSLAFFLYLSYFSRFSQKTSQTPQFDHFLPTFLPISPDPTSRFFSSSNLASQIKISLLKQDSSKSVQIYSSYRDDRQTDRQTDIRTDGRTDGIFF